MNKPETSIKVRHEPMRIAGRKVDAEATLNVHYPYTDTVIGTVPAGNAEHARRAFEIAASYQPKLTRYERQRILLRTAELLDGRKDEISDLITLELGISRQDSLYEVGRAFDVFTLAGQMVIHDDGEIFSCDLTPHGKQRKIFTIREPLKAISAITPFNHPLNMVSHKVAPAIATNNCVVVKPTELTPMTALLLADVLYEAGLPPEMLSVVTGWPADIGDEMITNQNVELITFTGGVPVGKMIAQKAGYRRQVLELGGNDPLIILNDLSDDDLAKAADLAVAGATKNSGQRCTAVKRILVEEAVAFVREIYMAITLDPTSGTALVLACAEGGVEIAPDEGAYLQGTLVILLAVLGSTNVHAHEDAQFGLETKALVAREFVHLAQVSIVLVSAQAVLHTIIAVQVGSRFDAGDDKVSRNAIAGVGHGYIFYDLSAHDSQDISGMAHSICDLLGQRLFLEPASGRVREGDAEVIGGETNAHAFDSALQGSHVSGHGQRGCSAVVTVRAGDNLQHGRSITDGAGHWARTIERRGECDQAIA